jgi:hypothetical protein
MIPTALFANCAIFGRDVAAFLDLKMSPPAAMGLLHPQGMVEAIREANRLKHEQLPLRVPPVFSPAKSKPTGKLRSVPPSWGQKQNCGTSYCYRISAKGWRRNSIVQKGSPHFEPGCAA